MPLAGKIVLILMILAIGWFFIDRCALAGAYVDPNGIRVKNPLRSTAIPWREIKGFSLGIFWWFITARADLRNGESVHIWGIQPPNPLTRPKNRSAEKLIEALKREHEAAGRQLRHPT